MNNTQYEKYNTDFLHFVCSEEYSIPKEFVFEDEAHANKCREILLLVDGIIRGGLNIDFIIKTCFR